MRVLGASTSHQTRSGDAPSTAAVSRKRGSRLRRAGKKVRTTKGKAISVCAIGVSQSDVRIHPSATM